MAEREKVIDYTDYTCHSNVPMKINEPSQLGIGLPLSQEKPQSLRVGQACDLAQWSLVLLQRIVNLILELPNCSVSSMTQSNIVYSQANINQYNTYNL